jgi:hypothetical protein
MRLNIKRNSLSRRLFFSSAIWTLVVLPFAAAVLISLYRDAVERSFDARLNQYLEYLIAITSRLVLGNQGAWRGAACL